MTDRNPGVPPGETPPAEGSTLASLSDAKPVPEQIPIRGNRTPMFVTLGILGVVLGVALLALLVALVTG